MDLSGLAAPIARVFQAPLPDALDMRLAFEVIEVVGFLQPASLTFGLADLAALGLGTIALPHHVTVVGMVEGLTV
jgi:hypothetical protein